MNKVIGIEGLVGAGKTSICRNLLNCIPNSLLLNGGNLYRAILSILLEKGDKIDDLIKIADQIDIKKVMEQLGIEIKIEDRETMFYYKGEKLDEEELQSSKSSIAVSAFGGIADNTALFQFAKDLINNLKKQYNVIVSGRALMQIYPDLDYHLFITASLEERVLRKNKQYNGKIDIKELEEHIKQRDMLQEKAGFYDLSPQTITIDVTDCKSVEDATNEVLKYIK